MRENALFVPCRHDRVNVEARSRVPSIAAAGREGIGPCLPKRHRVKTIPIHAAGGEPGDPQ